MKYNRGINATKTQLGHEATDVNAANVDKGVLANAPCVL